MADYKIQVIPILKKGEVEKQLDAVGKNADLGKKLGISWGQQFSRELLHKIDYAFINVGAKAIRGMVENVKELNAAQVELKKVSDLAGEALDKYTDKAYKAGESVARTGTEMVEGATMFKKMGYDETQSLGLAQMAARFQNIADTEISAGQAASFINSQLKAFGFTASDTEHVLDSVNEVANNFAVGTNDLQSALSKTGAALSTTGNSFEQTLGLVTAGEEILVNQSGKVGRGLRSIGLNLANAAKEADRFEGANGRVNIALKDEEGNIRSTFDIMKDLALGTKEGSVAWDKLNNAEKTAVGSAIAGKTQYEVKLTPPCIEMCMKNTNLIAGKS